jgi:adenosylhomocysteine nucleosidase
MIGIIGAMNFEVLAIINNIEKKTQINIAGYNFYKGKINRNKVVVVCCGIGKVNASACTQLLIDKFKIKTIINVGIAGGLHDNVNINDIVISENVTHHDVNKELMKNHFPYKEFFESDSRLISIAKNICESTDDFKNKYHIGRIVSGECFIEDSSTKKYIKEEYNPFCVEMEGSAIGHVSFINNIPFIVIRGISDNANDTANKIYEDYSKSASEQSSKIVLEIIKKYNFNKFN